MNTHRTASRWAGATAQAEAATLRGDRGVSEACVETPLWRSQLVFLRAVLAAVICMLMLLVPSAVFAQPIDRLSGNERDPSIPRIELAFGFDGVLGAGRFTPVTIRLTGGAEPFSGTVTLRYRQGGAQSIASMAAVAATPGRTVEVPLLLSPPPQFDTLEVELHNHRGVRVRTQNYRVGAMMMSGNDLPLPMALSAGTAIFVIVGDSPAMLSLNLAMQDWLKQGIVRRTAVNVQPNALPLHDSAYEGVHLLIVDEAAGRQIEPARAAAIRQWVASGGRVLVLTGRSGTAWRAFLPGPAAEAIEVGDLATWSGLDDLEAELEAMSALTLAEQRSTGLPTTWPPKPNDAETSSADLRVRTGEGVMGRPIRLRALGEAMGWNTRWMSAGSAEYPARPALLAEGPAGLGWAVVLGTEPRFLPDPVNVSNELMVVRAALSNILADFDRLQHEEDRYGWYAGPIPMSAEPMTVQSAQAQGFDVLLVGIESPSGAIVFVGIAMVLLALLVGPVDYIVLRRVRLSHRSWLTAIGWITLASVIAYALPNLSERGTTRLAQLHTVDAIAAPLDGSDAAGLGSASSASGTLPPPLAWRTSHVGLYSSTRDLLSIVDTSAVTADGGGSRGGGSSSSDSGGVRRITAPGGAWRGVSPTFSMWHQRQPTGVRLPMLQSAPPPQAAMRDDEWRGLTPGNAAATGGQSLQPMPVGPWTLRTFEGHQRDGRVIRASAHFSESSVVGCPLLTVTLEGLPAGAAVEHGSCSVGGRRVDLMMTEGVNSEGRVVLRSAPINAALLKPDRFSMIGPAHHGGMYGGSWTSFATEQFPEFLPGTERRSMAFEHLSETRRWIVVRCSLVSGDAGLLTLVRRNGEVLPHEVIERTVLRVAVPLDDESTEVIERLLADAPDLPPRTPTTGTRR